MSVDYIGTGLEVHHAALTERLDHFFTEPHQQPRWGPSDSTGSYRTQASTTQPVATSAGDGTGTSGGTSGGQPTFANGAYSGISPHMWDELKQAIQAGFAGISGGLSAGTIDDRIISYLRGTGDWTDAELAIVRQGADAAESHGEGFREQANDPGGRHGGDGGAALRASWWNSISQSLSSWLASVAPPGANDKPSTGSTDPVESAILAALSGNGGSTSGSGSTGAPQAGPIVQAGAPAGGFPVLPVLLIAGAGGLAWVYFKGRAHRAGEKAEG